jgi:hypothetical protein
MRDIFRAIISSFVKSFNDTFDRPDSTTLGTSSSGVAWNVFRNTFSISGNKAVAGSSDYSLAAVGTGSSDVEINLKGISQGTGASLWVTDSGNWWSVSIAQESEDCGCVNYYNTFTYNTAYNFSYSVYVPGNPYTVCTGYYTYYYSTFNFNSYNPTVAYYCCYGYNAAGNCKGNYFCGNTGGNGQYSFAYYSGPIAVTDCSSYASGNNAYSYNVSGTAYNTETGYAGPFEQCGTCYPQYIRIFQSVNNVISTVTTQLMSSVIQSLKINTASNQITVKAYSDANLVSQVDNDIVYNATGAVIYPRFGISVNPSAYAQGYSIDEISVD